MAANTQELQQELKDAIDGDNSERVLTLLDEHNPGIDAQIILASPAAIQHADAVLQAETLLHYAGRVGSKQVVEALIRRGAKVENEFTALFLPDHPIGTLANPDLIARFKIIYDFAVEQQSANPGNNRIRALKTVNDLKALCKSFDASIDSFTPTPGVDPVSGTIKEERGKVAAHFVWDELKRFLDDSTHAGNPKEIGIEFLKRIALLPSTIQLQIGFSKLQDFKNNKANAAKIERIQVKPFGSGKVLTGVAALDYFSAAIYSAINGDHSVSAEMQQAILIKIKEIVDGENQAIDFSQAPYNALPLPETQNFSLKETFIVAKTAMEDFFTTLLGKREQAKIVSSAGASLSLTEGKNEALVVSSSLAPAGGNAPGNSISLNLESANLTHRGRGRARGRSRGTGRALPSLPKVPPYSLEAKPGAAPPIELQDFSESTFDLPNPRSLGHGGHTVKAGGKEGVTTAGKVGGTNPDPLGIVVPQFRPAASELFAKSGTGFSHAFIPFNTKESTSAGKPREAGNVDSSPPWKEREQKTSFPREEIERGERKRPGKEERIKRKEKGPDPDDPADEESDENFLFSLGRRFFEEEEASSADRILGGSPGTPVRLDPVIHEEIDIGAAAANPPVVVPVVSAMAGNPLLSQPLNPVNGAANQGIIPVPGPAHIPGGAIARADLSGVSSLYNAAHRVYQYLQKADGYQHISLPVMNLFSTLNQFKSQAQLKSITLSNGKTIWETLNPEEKDKFKVEFLVGTAGHDGILGTAITNHKNYQQEQYMGLLAQVGGQYRPTGKKYYFQRSEADLIELIMLRDGETLTTAEMRDATHQLIVICQDVFDKIQVDVCVYDNPLFESHSGIELLKQTVITVASQGVELQAADKAKPQDHDIQKEACELKQKMVEPAPEFVDIEAQQENFAVAEKTKKWDGSTREKTLETRGIRIMTDKGRVLPKISDAAQDEQTQLRREYWTQVTQWEKDQRSWGSIVSATDILMNVLMPLNSDPNLYQKDGIYAHLMPLSEEGLELFDRAVEEQRKELEKWTKFKEQTQDQAMQRETYYSREGSSDYAISGERQGSVYSGSSSEDEIEYLARDSEDPSYVSYEEEDRYWDTGSLMDLDNDTDTTVRLRAQEMEPSIKEESENRQPSREEEGENIQTVHMYSRERRAAITRRSALWPSSSSMASSSNAPLSLDNDDAAVEVLREPSPDHSLQLNVKAAHLPGNHASFLRAPSSTSSQTNVERTPAKQSSGSVAGPLSVSLSTKRN